MKKLSKKEIVLLLILAVLIIGALYYNYILMPYLDKISDVKKNISTAKAEMEILTIHNRNLLKAKDEVERLKAGLSGTLSDIPIGIDEAQLLVLCSRAIDDLGDNTVYNFDADVVQYEFYQINNVSVQLSTNYNNLLEILANFRDLENRNRITDLSIGYVPAASTPIGPDPVTGTATLEEILAGEGSSSVGEGALDRYSLKVNMTIEFFSFEGELLPKDYDFMVQPINNPDMFANDDDIS